MGKAPGSIPPDRQRRFDRALRDLAALCPGREKRLSDYKRASVATPDRMVLERARWLLVAAGLARGTDGGKAMAALARRGYTVTSKYGWLNQPRDVVSLDTQGLLYLGYVLPNSLVPWKQLEAVAIVTDPVTLPALQWCSAHETLLIQTALLAEGHDLGSAG